MKRINQKHNHSKIAFISKCREGKGEASRTRLIDRLQSFLPPNVMLPPRRLRCLLKQAVQYQAEQCSCHDICWRTDLDNVSLLTDHDCGTDNVREKKTAKIELTYSLNTK